MPCYNEAQRLDMETFSGFLRTQPHIHLLFVNDGSTDRTADLLVKIAADWPGRAFVQSLSVNSGKSEAVRIGIQQAISQGYSVVGYWDADLATPLALIPELLDLLEKSPETLLVMGSRVKLLGYDIRRKMHRHYLGRVFATFVSWILGIPVYDTQCGAKLFRVDPKLARLFSQPFSSRWIFDVEIIARIQQIHFPKKPSEAQFFIKEHPLRKWEDVGGSKLKPIHFFKAIYELGLIFLTYRINAGKPGL